MKYVLYSQNPYLLARSCTVLQMFGYAYPDWWRSTNFDPFTLKCVRWLAVYADLCDVMFQPHDCDGPDTKIIRITESNYLEALETILKRNNNV